MTTVLAIDQGTSGTKAVVVGSDGEILSLSEVSVRPTYLPGGGVEHDPEALLDSVLRAGRVAVNTANVDVDVVTLANQGETVLAWDPDSGRPLSNMIVWQDRRSESICAELREHADEITARTGLVLDPYFSAPKQAWLRREVTTEGVVTTSDSWLLHRLTGEFVTDASTASRSLVVDLDDVAWAPRPPRPVRARRRADAQHPRVRRRGRIHDSIRRLGRGRRARGRSAGRTRRTGVSAAG
ncbi:MULTISPECIES: FGGY family carbohydrate kinase [unclassified Microbacterium]|uniref:FGGY family carbohydrate kinase n=1 Tax=unclassified Microbacterium TaxID=2609290 RepID=UPI00342CB20B